MLENETSLKDLALRIYKSQYEAIQAVVASTVHESNNILSIVLGAVEGIDDESKEPEINRDELASEIASLRKSLARLQSAISDLRKVYRPTGMGKKESNLSQVMGNVYSVFDFKLKRSRLATSLGEIPEIMVPIPVSDLSIIFSVFLNNAAEATEEFPDQSLDFSVEHKSMGSDECIEFISKGGSMSTEVQEKLGQPFVTSKNKETHLGLGIFVAKEMLESYGGSLKWDISEKLIVFRLVLPGKY